MERRRYRRRAGDIDGDIEEYIERENKIYIEGEMLHFGRITTIIFPRMFSSIS